MPSREDMLHVPGATLYYRKVGSGPLLLVLQGGDGDANGTLGISQYLTARFTVVTYDRRGLSRSKIDNHAGVESLAVHTDDAHYLLAALTTEPAFVFGTSLGGVLGLDLVSRYPSQVRALITHEPPVTQLLPQAEQAEATKAQEEVESTFLHEGISGAMKKFAELAGLNFQDREPGVVMPAPTEGRAANLDFFLRYDAQAVRLFNLDVPALKAAELKVTVAAGQTSRGRMTHRCAEALAKLLNKEAIEFPGGHAGFITHPRGFAEKLLEILGAHADCN